jgi:hypothetical protein
MFKQAEHKRYTIFGLDRTEVNQLIVEDKHRIPIYCT